MPSLTKVPSSAQDAIVFAGTPTFGRQATPRTQSVCSPGGNRCCSAITPVAVDHLSQMSKYLHKMLCEMFRICSHLLFYGTFAQDVGQLSPIFYMFVERERIFNIIESICGARMHPGWFRIGGVAQDLPNGWEKRVKELLDFMPARMDEYDGMVMKNGILKRRTQGIGVYGKQEAGGC